jgi:hypothetical protein
LKKKITKGLRKKLKIKTEDQIEKHNTINLNWIMKLKTTETFIKWPMIKIKNLKNEDYIGKCFKQHGGRSF